MKQLTLFVFSLLFTTSAFSQNFLGMKVLKYGLAATSDQDRVNDLNAQYFVNLAKSSPDMPLNESEFSTRNLTSMTCENPALRGVVTVAPFPKFENIQLDLGANLMFNRVDATNYSFSYFTPTTTRNEFHFSSYSHEAAIDASLLYNKKLGFLNFYGGVGSNLGVTFAGRMNLNQVTYEQVDNLAFSTETIGSQEELPETSFSSYSSGQSARIKNVLHQRAFVQGGVSIIILKRLELGIEARRGIGYRYNRGNSLKFTNLVGGGVVAKWNLK